MPAPQKIIDLVKRFEENRDAYTSGVYNETQLRREFLDPFFKELGWDVDNEGGLTEAYKDVIHEDAIRIGGVSKAPDYCFRVGGTRKFFVEAKKPSVNLAGDVHPAFQVRRYAWSANLPLSILTDFEEFAVYDCRLRPLKADKPSTARLMYFSFKDYIVKWDEIAGIFSRDAVLKGAFDHYAGSSKSKRGVDEVDKAFLKEIQSWRELLAKNIALRNPKLSNRELNFAVQRTIDRIIFLRICEDRGIEDYGKLKSLLSDANIYKRLLEVFADADARYNSGLFHFREEKDCLEMPDEITTKIKIEDSVFKSILNSLYYPESPYEFSVLPVEILGQVYEQFLGQVIHLTEGHRARIEEKPEVKKAGGVYYTPRYIVEYIVKNTIGKLLEGKTPKQAASLRVLDPACGSGSFLIGAYQYLLDWHRDWYVKDGVEKWTKGKKAVLYQHGDSDWRLTVAEKKRILLNNIYGVDIDSQAVEVTKLSLLLKVLEGENGQAISKQYQLFHERVLPDLGNNIKCGNSLIGSDYHVEHQLTIGFSNEELRYRINAFDWKSEFPQVFIQGGFNAVIGNPPYVFGGNYGIEQDDKKYFKEHYYSGSGKINLFTLFVEKSINVMHDGGLVSYIIPNTLLRVTSYANIREFILKNTAIKQIVDLGAGVFSGATTSSIIIVLEKSKESSENRVEIFTAINEKPQLTEQSAFLNNGYVLNIKSTSQDIEILQKLNTESVLLGELCQEMIFGVVITKNRDEVVSDKPLKGYKPFLEGKDITRYFIKPVEKYLLYKPKLLHRSRTPKIFESSEKILIQRITGGKRPLNAAYDNQQYYNKESINNIILKDGTPYSAKFILGLINSQLINWFYRIKFTNESKLTVNLSKEYLSQIPIRLINFTDSSNKARHDKVVSFVEQMLLFNKQLTAAKTDHEKTALQRQIDTTDAEIDRLVYQLYNLTEEEIKIVEDSMVKK